MANALRMSKMRRFCPPWRWWIRSGERAVLGIGVRHLMDPDAVTGSANKSGLEAALTGIGEGRTVIASMKASGMILPAEGWCLLETSEQTGRLGEGMQEIGEFLKGRQERSREIIGQMWYPGLILIVGIAVMGLILLWVVPQMREVSQSMGLGEQMPWLTENIGILYGSLFTILVGAVFFTVIACAFLHFMGNRNYAWATFEERIIGVIPGVGRIRSRMREASILRQLGILLKGGITLPAALQMVAKSVSSKWVQLELLNYRSRLLMGSNFRVALEACRLFERDNVSMLLAGQESGKLDIYMERISTDLSQQVAWAVTNATRLLEPVMLLGLSGGIGGLILAYLLPMVRMLEQAGGAF